MFSDRLLYWIGGRLAKHNRGASLASRLLDGLGTCWVKIAVEFSRSGFAMQRTITHALVATCLVAGLAAAGCAKKTDQTTADEPVTSAKKAAELPATPQGPQVVRPLRRDQATRLRMMPAFRDWGVRDTAADALGRIGDAAVPALIAALEDPDRDVRTQATRALARMGAKAESAIPALIEALNDDDKEVRQGAARALGQIGPLADEAVPALVQALRDPRNKATEEAVETEVEIDEDRDEGR
jgi:HEAT repeat protein